MRSARWKRFWVTFIAIWALTAVLSAPISPVSATASPKVSNRTYATYSGIQYHVYANNIDYSKPVGAVYYLDGDY